MSERVPTHLCLDCGAVGYAGGYHDHGNGNAGDTASIAEVLRMLAEAGDAADERDALRPIVAHIAGLVAPEAGFEYARIHRQLIYDARRALDES